MLLPNHLPSDAPNSEKTVWKLAQSSQKLTSDSCFFIHSVHSTIAPRSIDGEVDFVYIDKQIILFLEAKGGEARYDELNDQWWIGGATRASDPFQQISRYVHHYIKNVFPNYLEQHLSRSLLVGYGLMFPDAAIDGIVYPKRNRSYFLSFSIEHAPKILFTYADVIAQHGLDGYIDRLKNFWVRQRNQTSLPSPLVMTESQIRKVKEIFRKNLTLKVPLLKLLNDAKGKVEFYTQEQLTILNNLKDNLRFGTIIQGGPGTGKTIIALDFAHHFAKQGKKILLLCYNKVLCAHLKASIATLGVEDAVEVANFHDFMVKELKEVGIKFTLQDFRKGGVFWTEELPKLFLDKFREERPWGYDFLVVDEAQDLFTMHLVNAMSCLLKHGFNGGNFLFLLDDKYQSFYKNFDPEFFNEFLSQFRPISWSLQTNCRNPENLIKEACEFTKLDTMTCKLPPNNEKLSWNSFSSTEDLQKQVTSLLEELQQQNIPAQDISIITTSIAYKNALSRLNRNTFELTQDTCAEMPSKTAVCTIHSYKGLDNYFVILVGKSLAATKRDLASLYFVGFTRAKAKLYLFLEWDQAEAT